MAEAENDRPVTPASPPTTSTLTPTASPTPSETSTSIAPSSLTEAIESAEFGLDEGVAPIPVRYWWAKRLAVAVVPIVFALLCARFGWGWIAQRNLDAEIAKYVAAGEPIYPKDFDSVFVEDKDNAAKLYLDAATALTFPSGDQSILSNLDKPWEYFAERGEEIDALLEANAVVFEKVREARSLSGVDWKKRYRTPMISGLPPHLSAMRALSKFLALATIRAEMKGDTDEAVEYVLDAIAHATASDMRPSVLDHLVAIAHYAMVARRIEALLPSIRICDNGLDPEQSRSCLSRETVEKLGDLMKDTDAMYRSHHYAALVERATGLDTLGSVTNGNTAAFGLVASPAGVISGQLIFAIKPVLLADTLFGVQHLDKNATALKEATWPAARKLMPPWLRPANIVDKWCHFLSNAYLPSLDRAIQLHYRCAATREMAGLALSIRLYELDHGGRPSSLEELVPEYIESLPIDPFGDGVATFGYLPDALWPRIYTVGPNGTDDLGEIGFRPKGSINWDHLDPPFFLEGAAPRDEDEFSRPRGSGEGTTDDDGRDDQGGDGE